MSKQQPERRVNSDEFSLHHVARFILAGMATIYMFGQLFFSSYSAATIGIAMSGLVVAFSSKRRIIESRSLHVLVVGCCIFGAAGISYDIHEYYSQPQNPDNYYPAGGSIAFILSFLVSGYYCLKYKKHTPEIPNKK